MYNKIAIIGGGNLGTAIAEGLLKSEFSKPSDITITRRNLGELEALKNKGVNITSDNAAAIKNSDVVILAVKPFQIKDVLEGFKTELDPQKHILVSVITGIFIEDMQNAVQK